MENIKTEHIIINMMSEGLTQKEVSEGLESLEIKPSSLSFVEKTLRRLKHDHKAKTIVHLFVILKDKKII